MITPLPQKGEYTQLNNSDVIGSIWASLNLDLTSNIGKLRIAQRLMKTTDSTMTNSTDLQGVPVGFRYYNSAYWTAGTNKMFTATHLTDQFILDVSSGSPTTINSSYSDLDVFNGILYVSADSTSLYKNTAGTWSTITSKITNQSYPHMMARYGGNLYITDYSQITKLTSGDSASNAITITEPLTNYLSTIRAGSNRIWVGTINTLGGRARIFEWDGNATQFTREYSIQASGVLACVIKDDIPYFVDTDGTILKLGSGQFLPVARFPTPFNKSLFHSTVQVNNRAVHPNGIIVGTNKKIQIFINNLPDDSTVIPDQRCPAGIWELDETTGSLYHVGAPSYYNYSGGTVTDFGQQQLAQVGALFNAKIDSTNASDVGDILAGAAYNDTGGTLQAGIWVNDASDTIQKSGYFITTKVFSDQITSTWQKVYTTYRKFLSATDKIIVKYRNVEVDPTHANITWTSTTTFTTTTDTTSYVIKDEIEILRGSGSGLCTRISNISRVTAGSTTTTTITIEDAVTSATGIGKVRFQKWIQIASITGQTTTFKESPLNSDPNIWVELKFIFLFTGKGEFEGAFLTSKPQQTIN